MFQLKEQLDSMIEFSNQKTFVGEHTILSPSKGKLVVKTILGTVLVQVYIVQT